MTVTATPTEKLTVAVAHVLGLDEVQIVSAPSGAGHAAFCVLDPAAGARDPIAFVRADLVPNEGAGITHSLAGEGDLIRAAAALGLPVPEVLGTTDDPHGLVMSMVEGTSTPSPAEVERVAPQYMGLLAVLHRADHSSFPLDPAATVTEAISHDFRQFQVRAHAGGLGDIPLIRCAERILELTMPQLSDAPNVLHGDAGAGNFMVHDGVVAAMLDWELSHLGDYHEDLAWMWMRGAHTSFGDPKQRIAEYVLASGRDIDEFRLQWHLVYVMWKSLVSIHLMLSEPEGTDRTLLHYVVQLTYGSLIGSAIGRLVGAPVSLLAQEPVHTTNREAQLASRVLASVTLPREAEIALDYLRDKGSQSAWEAQGLAEDSRSLLGIDVVDIPRDIETAELAGLAKLNTVLARDADRASRALPKAVRRIERGQRIGLAG